MTAEAFLQALAIAAIPSAAAAWTAWIALRDLGMRRRLQTSKQSIELFATAHARPVDGREVGRGEQIATVHLIADFARHETLTFEAARAGLSYIAAWRADLEWAPGGKEVGDAASDAPEAARSLAS